MLAFPSPITPAIIYKPCFLPRFKSEGPGKHLQWPVPDSNRISRYMVYLANKRIPGIYLERQM